MIMISMPMNYYGWRTTYADIKNRLEQQGYKVAPLTYKELYGKREPDLVEGLKIQTIPLLYMAHAFIRMSLCDTVYFVTGWETARGCRLEHQAAQDYGLKIIYEEPSTN